MTETWKNIQAMMKRKLATQIVPGDVVSFINELWLIVSINHQPCAPHLINVGKPVIVFTYLTHDGAMHKQVVNNDGAFQVLYNVM